jgi:hypothetical protein
MYFEFARCGHGVKEQARAGTDFGTVVLVRVVLNRVVDAIEQYLNAAHIDRQ